MKDARYVQSHTRSCVYDRSSTPFSRICLHDKHRLKSVKTTRFQQLFILILYYQNTKNGRYKLYSYHTFKPILTATSSVSSVRFISIIQSCLYFRNSIIRIRLFLLSFILISYNNLSNSLFKYFFFFFFSVSSTNSI